MDSVLVIGPSPTLSKGGMASVLSDIQKSQLLNEEFKIEIFSSYVDGFLLKRILFMLMAFIRFYFTKRNYDLYHIHLASRTSTYRKCFYLRLLKKWRKKVIVHIHGGKYLTFLSGLSETKRNRIRNYLNESDLVLTLSQKWQESISSYLGLQNCFVLANGIDELNYVNVKPASKQTQNQFVVLGRITQAKGIYFLLEGLRQVVTVNPHIKVYLAGSGEIDLVKQKIAQYGLEKNVFTLGWLDNQDKLDLLNQVSTLILPSYHEGLPMAILEAMAAGKLIISTKVGAIPEVLDKTSNILIEAGNLEALVQAIQSVLSLSETQLATIGQENRRRISQQYSQFKMHHKLAAYYRMVLERKR